MSDRFLRKEEVAALFNCATSKAIALLKEHHVACIDLGRGRGGGPRWLESSVQALMLQLHTEAQNRCAPPAKKKRVPSIGIAGMNVNQLMTYLDKRQTVQ